MTTTIEAWAKVNLVLEVFGKRADGFHALRSLVATVDFGDTLRIDATSDGTLESDTGYLDDLCVRAAAALRAADPRAAGKGARVRVEKRIPAGGGLGGGSADAAATLVALDAAWGLGLGEERLAQIGASVGSDVPALVMAGKRCAVVMEGRGETVRDAGARFRPLPVVLAFPGVHSSTAEVYSHCIPRSPGGPGILYNMLSALESGDPRAVADAMVNDLDGPAERLHPEIAAVKSAMEDAGVLKAMASGSGSTVFGPVPGEAAGLEIAASLREAGIAARFAKTRCPVV